MYFKALLVFNALKCSVNANYLAGLFKMKEERHRSSLLNFNVETDLTPNVYCPMLPFME